MKIPLQLTFRDMEHSDAVAADVNKYVEKLEELFPGTLMSCRVMVESRHRHHHQGNLFHVRIDITVPGNELVVSRDPRKHQAHEEMHVVVRDAFAAARRQLEHYTQKQRRKVKTHESPLHGRVTELTGEQDYGRIQTDDGRDIYFHRNSLLNQDFTRLNVGDEVRFDEETGDLGPQATTVRVIGKHHILPDRP